MSAALELVTPVGVIERTSEWGQRGVKYHHGIDLYAPFGSPVYAAAAGIVIASVDNGAPGYARYGQTIRIEHSDGLETLYAHLSARSVRAGQRVRAGQEIGKVGDTRGTPADPDDRFEYSLPHLHFEVLIGAYPASRGGPDGSGPIRSMNPRRWYEEHGFNLETAFARPARSSGLAGVLVFLGAGALGAGIVALARRFRA